MNTQLGFPAGLWTRPMQARDPEGKALLVSHQYIYICVPWDRNSVSPSPGESLLHYSAPMRQGQSPSEMGLGRRWQGSEFGHEQLLTNPPELSAELIPLLEAPSATNSWTFENSVVKGGWLLVFLNASLGFGLLGTAESVTSCKCNPVPKCWCHFYSPQFCRFMLLFINLFLNIFVDF